MHSDFQLNKKNAYRQIMDSWFVFHKNFIYGSLKNDSSNIKRWLFKSVI